MSVAITPGASDTILAPLRTAAWSRATERERWSRPINYKEVKKLEKYSSAIKVIKQSMFKVVNESKGTAFRSKSDDFIFSGKTGTSQVRRITVAERESDDFRKKEIEWEKRDHALFVGYMPHDKPKYAVSVVIEHGGSGASTAAPIAKQIFQFINKNNI